MATVKTNVIQIDTTPATKSIKDLRKEIKDLKDQMAGLDAGSDAFLEAANKAGELQHQIDEISQSVRGASADFGDMLGNVSKVGAGFTGAFQTAAAAMNLFGVESSNVTKAIQKMQSLMAITQGLSAIDAGIKAWKKFSAAIKATTLVQNIFNRSLKQTSIETKGASVGATGLSASMKGTAVATGSATVATRAFGLALKAIGIGLIIEGVNLLIKGIEKLVEWFSKFKETGPDFVGALAAMNQELASFQSKLSDQKNLANFSNNLYKAYNNLYKSAIENQKTSMSFSEMLSNNYLAELLDTFYAIEDFQSRLFNLFDNFNELNAAGHRISSLSGISGDLKGDIEKVVDALGTFNANTGVTKGLLSEITKMYKPLEKVFHIIKQAKDESRVLTKEEQEQLRIQFSDGQYEDFIKKLRGNYNNILIIKRELNEEINSINAEIAKGGLTDEEIKQREAVIGILKNYIAYFDDAESQISSIFEKYNDALSAFTTTTTNLNNLAVKKTKEEAEILKAEIDGRATRDEMYKNSVEYLKDQIRYWNMLLGLEQKGTANAKKIEETIANLQYQIRMLYKDMNSTSKSDILGFVIDPKVEEDLKKKVEKALADLDKIVLPHFTTWKDTLRELIWDVGHQFEVLTNTLALYQESSLGLSGNYINAANDIKKTFDQLMQNIIDGGDAGWTQWSQSAGMAFQAAGSMLNALSAEQDAASEEGFESQKKLQIAATIMNMLSGITMAWSTAMELGPIAGPIAGAINSAMIAGIGAAQLAKIKSTTFGGGNSGGYSTNGVGSLIAPIQYTANVADATKERDVRDTRVYVTEHDITDTQRRVQVAQSEARF